jgi:hypothetical protein
MRHCWEKSVTRRARIEGAPRKHHTGWHSVPEAGGRVLTVVVVDWRCVVSKAGSKDPGSSGHPLHLRIIELAGSFRPQSERCRFFRCRRLLLHSSLLPFRLGSLVLAVVVVDRRRVVSGGGSPEPGSSGHPLHLRIIELAEGFRLPSERDRHFRHRRLLLQGSLLPALLGRVMSFSKESSSRNGSGSGRSIERCAIAGRSPSPRPDRMKRSG